MRNLGKIVLFSRDDVSSLFGIGAESVQALFYNEEFPAVKIGRNWFVEENALINYLQERHILAELRANKKYR